MFRDYGLSFKKPKEPLPPRDVVVEFDVRNNAKELYKNLNLQVCPSDLQENFK